MAAVSLENWQERIRDPKIECMSRDEMTALQSEKLVKQVKKVYEHVPFYRKKMQQKGVEPGDIRGIEDIGKLPFTTKEDLKNNYPFGLLAVPQSEIVRVQGTSGTTGKLTIASYTQKDVEVWGECVARGLTMAGLTNEDRIHVCYGYGLFTGGLGLDYGAMALGAMANPHVRRQHKAADDVHGGHGGHGLRLHTVLRALPGGVHPGGGACGPHEAESRHPRRRALDGGDEKEDRGHPPHQLLRHLRPL